jgi:predicted DNA binding CopG/RHH family protein
MTKPQRKPPKNTSGSKAKASYERPIQLASKSQLLGQDLEDVTPIVQFLEDFRIMSDSRAQKKSRLISIKIPEPMLAAFKYKSAQTNTPYQTKIKQLMLEWLSINS